MAMNSKEEFLRRAASEYVERQGEAFKEEVARFNQETHYPTANLERRIFKAVRQRKRRFVMPLVAAAACLALLFFGGRTLFQNIRYIPDIPKLTDQTSDDRQLISLSFQVPTGFTQTGAEQDQGQSIYYFDDQLGDNVVLTLEKPEVPIDESFYTQLDINGASAYAASRDYYQIMMFEKDDVLYTLTCRYDVNTLLRFSEKIL
jgi:hypothetical protein